MYPNTRSIPCTIQRAGTSKGIYFLENQLPSDPALRDRVILSIFGSPDKRQIDGLGGADPLTSKMAMVIGSDRPDADIEYTFAQVAIDKGKVLYGSLCGNITSGVGPFAVNNGLVKPVEGITRIRMYNRNTGKIIIEEVPVKDGRAAFEGDYAIAGVPGTGAKLVIDFSQAAGALAGKGLLPTGSPMNTIDVEGVGPIDVSIVDIAGCQVFVRATDLGLTGTETPRQVDSDPELLRRLEAIRAHGAYLAGLSATPGSASVDRLNTPHLVIVGKPNDYASYLTGETISGTDIDLSCRLMFMQIMHKTYAGTGSICTSVAVRIPGTIPWQIADQKKLRPDVVRIGHPAGIIEVEAEVSCGEDDFIVRRAAIGRTARTILEGQVYVPERIFRGEGK